MNTSYNGIMKIHFISKMLRSKKGSVLGSKKYGTRLNYEKPKGGSVLGCRKITSKEILHKGERKSGVRKIELIKD